MSDGKDDEHETAVEEGGEEEEETTTKKGKKKDDDEDDAVNEEDDDDDGGKKKKKKRKAPNKREPKAKKAKGEKGKGKTKKGKKARKKKDPDAPKKALTAWMYYGQERRPKLKAKHPDMKQSEILQIMGKEWKELSKDEKKPFDEQAAKDKKRYEKEKKIGRAVQQECRDRSRMPSSA
eukprot:TRINITY_DN2710_c0_g1_i9.p1 TRINITY_DN2710_c0_g1~~TRINITY_DN2710_c0_g1_i9.p1  ORF type:complete len:178 (-),score=55.68 TRINITY_DN2710_c0_g1_i9:22-555(-)